jgi:hypothetical protein
MTFEKGTVTTNAASKNVETARAARLYASLGGRKAISRGCWISGMDRDRDALIGLGRGVDKLRHRDQDEPRRARRQCGTAS